MKRETERGQMYKQTERKKFNSDTNWQIYQMELTEVNKDYQKNVTKTTETY